MEAAVRMSLEAMLDAERTQLEFWTGEGGRARFIKYTPENPAGENVTAEVIAHSRRKIEELEALLANYRSESNKSTGSF